MTIEWRTSAFKHYPLADALHAIQNRRAVVEQFDIDRETGEPFDLFIGPARDGTNLEVFIMRDSLTRTARVFHVLHLTPKTVARAQAIIAARVQRQTEES